MLITDHDDWPVPEVIAGYRSQSEAEFSFRQMKDPHVVSFSPMHHWTEHNIKVHVFTCVLALQIAHLMRRTAAQAGLHLSVRQLLAQLAGIGETVLWTPTGFVDTIRSGTMVYEERTGSGTGSQEVHPGI